MEILCGFQDEDSASHLGIQLRICTIFRREIERETRGTGNHLCAIFQGKDRSNCREFLFITWNFQEIVSDRRLLCSF